MKDIKIEDASFFPAPNPLVFKEVNNPLFNNEYGKAWTSSNGLLVICTAGEYDDGNEWLHVSFSRKSRTPTYDDVTLVKRYFVGEDKKAVMVWPDKEHYVNLHPNCLHLFYSAKNPLPEFSKYGSI